MYWSTAKRQASSLDLHLVENTHDVNQLGWVYRKSHGREEYYPCRKCCKDEYDGLFTDVRPGSIVIRILGWKNWSTGSYDQIPNRQWQNFLEEAEAHGEGGREEKSNTGNDNNNNERKLQIFLRMNEKTFQDDPVGLKLEELAVKAQWERVHENQRNMHIQARAHRQEEEKEENNEGATGNGDSTQNLLSSTTSKAQPPTVSKENSPNNAASSDDDSDDDDDDDDDDNGKKKSKDKLRDGDVIEYYDPIGVAGKQEWLKRATILGIRARATLPLNLDNGQLGLDKSCRIKLVQRRLRGKLVDVETSGSFKPIRDFALKTCGTTELVALKGMAERSKAIRQSHQDGVGKFWEENGDRDDQKGKEDSRNGDLKKTGNFKAGLTTTEKMDDKKAPAVISQEEESKSDEKTNLEENQPVWKTQLQGLLEETIEKKKRNKRSRLSMEPEQLSAVLEVWSKLQQRINQSGESTQEVVLQLAKAMGMPHVHLDPIMHGDEDKAVTDYTKKKTMVALSEWLENRSAVDKFINVATIESVDEPPEPKSSRKETRQSMVTKVPSFATYQGKRRKSAKAMSRSSSSSSLMSLEKEGDSTTTAVGSRKRRVAQSVDVNQATKSSAKSRKHRSCLPAVETVNSKSIIRTETTNKPQGRPPLSKRKAAPKSYEPTSVTVRKKRKSAALARSSSTLDSGDDSKNLPRRRQCKNQPRNEDKGENNDVPSRIEQRQIEIKNKIEAETKKKEAKRRYKPHMSIEQLEFVWEFWEEAKQLVDDPNSKGELKDFIIDVSLNVKYPQLRIMRFVQGDRDRILSDRALGEVHKLLQTWLAEKRKKTTKTAGADM